MPDTARIDLEKNRILLQEKIAALLPSPGDHPTLQKGLCLHRYNSNGDPKPLVYKPVVIVVVQGKKRVKIGDEEFVYGENSFFVAGVDMPAASCVQGITPESPFLSISLELDRSLITQLAAEMPAALNRAAPSAFISAHAPRRGAYVRELDTTLLDAFLRLIELLEAPESLSVLGPLLVKEIHYRLLSGPFGDQLRLITTFGSQCNQIARAISWLLDNFKEPLQVEDLAESVNMAPSTFHKHFKEVTSLSPLQYQKRLRLTEAQRLMLSDRLDAARASLAVGYESATQFNREYKRLFGQPPRRDVFARTSA